MSTINTTDSSQGEDDNHKLEGFAEDPGLAGQVKTVQVLDSQDPITLAIKLKVMMLVEEEDAHRKKDIISTKRKDTNQPNIRPRNSDQQREVT